MDELVEDALRQAALWDEVKDKLKESGLARSSGQQQSLCLAHSGRIWVEEPPARSGACVCFTLPLSEAPSAI